MPLPGRTLLACWLTVVLTGAVVTHRHAAAPGHTHHLGWVALPGGTDGDLPLSHRHFLLLGVEFGAVTGEVDGSAGCDGTHSAAGEVVPTDDASRLADVLPDHGLTAVPEAFALSADDFTLPTGLDHSTASPCALVSHARTGVLRS
jgi:hypothetical protein